MEVVFYLSIFFGYAALCILPIGLLAAGKISKKRAFLMLLVPVLLPYIVSAITMEDFLVFWAVYTVLLLCVLIFYGILKLFHKE